MTLRTVLSSLAVLCAVLAASCVGPSVPSVAEVGGAAPDAGTACDVGNIVRVLGWVGGDAATAEAARSRLLRACLDKSDRLCTLFLERLAAAPADHGIHVNMLCAAPCDIERAGAYRAAVRATRKSLVCGADVGPPCPGGRDNILVKWEPDCRQRAEAARTWPKDPVDRIVDWCRPTPGEAPDCSPAAISIKTVDTAKIIVDAIVARRKSLRAAIEARMRDGADAYPAEAALVDAIAYHNECNIAAGLLLARRSIRERQTLTLRHLASAVGATAAAPSASDDLPRRLRDAAECLPREAALRAYLDDALAVIGGR